MCHGYVSTMYANVPLYKFTIHAQGQLSKKIERKIAIIFLSITLNLCFGCSKELSQTCVLGAQKNRLIETVLLSTHNICLVEKKEFSYARLSVACTCLQLFVIC